MNCIFVVSSFTCCNIHTHANNTAKYYITKRHSSE